MTASGPFPFSTEDAAVAFARSMASQLCRHGEPEEQSIDGWLFYATFSVEEGDCVWVQAKDLDQGSVTG